MVDVSGLMKRLCNSEDDDIGMVNHVEDQRWIVGDHDLFPIHVEELVNGQGVLLYATILRETSEPVYLPLIRFQQKVGWSIQWCRFAINPH